jgi:hypothetical protein
MPHGSRPITEITELQKAYHNAFAEVGAVIYLLIACLAILAVAAILRLVWGSGKIYSFKLFDPKRDRKKPENKKSTGGKKVRR